MIALKNITKVSLAFASMVMFACSNSFDDKRLDFSENQALYVKFSSTSKMTLTEGDTARVQVELPVVTYKPITVGYAIAGDYATTGTVVIPSGAKTAVFKIIAPNDKTVSATKNSTVTITSVDNGLVIGYHGTATSFPLKIVDDTKMISFDTDSTGGFESGGWALATMSITNPAAADITLHYSVTGGTAGVDYSDPGAGVLQIKKGDTADTIALKILDNIQKNVNRTLVVTITSIVNSDPDDQETSINGDADTFKFTIVDDLKYVSLAGDADISETGLTSADYAGAHSYDVVLTGAVDQPVTVNYTVSGSGVNDLSGGALTFLPSASTTQQITLDFTTAAFAADQTVTVTLTSIVSNDKEVVFNDQDAGTKITLGLKQ